MQRLKAVVRAPVQRLKAVVRAPVLNHAVPVLGMSSWESGLRVRELPDRGAQLACNCVSLSHCGEL